MIDFNGKEIKGNIISALSDVLIMGAENIADESRSQAPKDSGALKENCKVTVENYLGVTIGYDLPYAVIQHENIDSHHENGKVKFLEEPFLSECENIIHAAYEAVKRVIR